MRALIKGAPVSARSITLNQQPRQAVVMGPSHQLSFTGPSEKKKRCLSPICAEEDLKISTFSLRLMVVKMLFPFFFFLTFFKYGRTDETTSDVVPSRGACIAIGHCCCV